MSLDIRPNPSASAGGITGGLTYKGSYDAALQTPNLTSSKKGDFYIVSDAGSLDGVALNTGDHIVFNQDASSPITSAMFDVIDNTDAVASVNAQTGVVVLDTDDISEGSNLYFTSGRAYVAADARIGAADLTDLNDVSYTAGPGIDNFVLTYDNASNSWGAEASEAAPVSSVNTQTGAVVLDSDDIAEGTSNLYYTNARFDTQLATKDTDNLSEGTTNLYYTNARFDTQLATKDSDDVAEGTTNLYYTNARFDTQLATKDTGDLAEGSNLYYTNARADARIGAADLTDLNDVNYTAGAGIDNYVLTYNHANTRWEAEVPATAPVSSVNTQTGAVVLDSDDVGEGTTNLYYTNARFDTQLATKDTDNLSEGTSNLYYTNARFDTQLATKDTGDLPEGSNLYYTNARSDARIGAADLTDLNDVNYTAGAGIDNYVLTYNHANTRWEAEVPATAPVASVNTQTGAVVLDSDDVAEGTTNLYYTNARFDSRFDTQLGTKDTGDLAEGSNLYYTNARFDTQLGTKDTDNLSEGTSNLYYTNARFDTQLGTKDTGDLAEGSNLYYTNARSDARIAAANLTDLNDVSYTAGAGIDNFVLTYNHANTRWEAEAAAGGGGSTPDTTTVSQGTDYTISTSTGIEEAFFITPTADINVNLPSAVTVGEGYKYNIKNLASGFSLTVDADGSQTIDASLTYVINNQFQSITIMSDGANWFII